jgi:hypothetical protein
VIRRTPNHAVGRRDGQSIGVPFRQGRGTDRSPTFPCRHEVTHANSLDRDLTPGGRHRSALGDTPRARQVEATTNIGVVGAQHVDDLALRESDLPERPIVDMFDAATFEDRADTGWSFDADRPCI